MASSSKAKANERNILDAQKAQLMHAFSEVAQAMRQAANEADIYGRLIETLGPDGKQTAATISAWNSRDQHNLFHLAASLQPAGLPGANGHGDAPTKKRGRKEKEGGKVKAIKDPNAPKRPASAYLLFQNEIRKEYMEKMKGEPYQTILGEISKAWAALDADKKQQYTDRTSEAKKHYNVEKAAYDLTKVGPVSPPEPIPEVLAAATPVTHDTSADEEEDEEAQVIDEEASISQTESEEEGAESDDEEERQPTKKAKLAPPPPPPSTKKARAKAEDKKEKKVKK